MTTFQESVDEFEKKLLELWDRIYQYWLSKNDHFPSAEQGGRLDQNDSVIDNPSNLPKYGPQVSEEAITSSVEEVIHRVLTILDLSAFSQFTLNNMGTLISVLEQGWNLLKGNLGFALTVITEVLRILFQSGSGMINFVLSTTVYFTALFYLLGSDSNVYKPVEIISNYSGMFVGTGFANALNRAINSVFTVTFKMAAFYGLWTYLTHAVFRASIITVPVIVATFLAAVPVAGQYLVALPAALELWLREDRWISALALIFCHLCPTYVVDAAIYAEVKQGIHPWITGLSIVGGVYCFGISGTIYGPLCLCGVYVILTVYTGWLQDIPMETSGTMMGLGKSKMQQTIAGTPVMKRSESVY
jgi:predicted PurR-regulated permease PerM